MRKVTIENNRIYFDFAYNLEIKERIRSLQGVRWHPTSTRWSVPLTPDPEITKIIDYYKFSAKEYRATIRVFKAKKAKNLRASVATTASFSVVGLGGKLRKYQKAGAKYLCENPKCILGDDLGLGKTVEALAALHVTNAFPATIVAPASLQYNWLAECTKWLPKKSVAILGEGSTDSDILILSYEKLSRLLKLNREHKTFICDESQYLRNYKTVRYKAAKAASLRVDYCWLLTGSALINHPMEIIPQLDVIGKLKDFGGYDGFVARYCETTDRWAEKKTHRFKKVVGYKNLDDLKLELRQVCMIRRTKEQVLSELPPIQHISIPVAISKVTEYKRLDRDLNNIPKINKISMLRQWVGVHKLPAIFEHLPSLIDEGRKLVIFTYHVNTLLALEEYLEDQDIECVTHYGEMSLKERDNAVRQFQDDEECQVFLGSLGTASDGLTLTAASNVAFVERGWTPLEVTSAIARLHRFGQTKKIFAYFFHAHGTLDDAILRVVERKEVITNLDLDKELLKELERT
jgi:SWI/SNF-related matrix-associated actin-dependent regulator 1 of chromatin subfamily A